MENNVLLFSINIFFFIYCISYNNVTLYLIISPNKKYQQSANQLAPECH